MAVTDGMIGLIAAAVIIYFTLYKNPVRWKRMIGSTALVVISVGFGLIADTALMYIPSAMLFLVGTIQLVEDASKLG